jgi:hypothetical protein
MCSFLALLIIFGSIASSEIQSLESSPVYETPSIVKNDAFKIKKPQPSALTSAKLVQFILLLGRLP